MKNLNKFTLILFGWLMLFSINASAQNYVYRDNSLNKAPLQEFVSYISKKNKDGVDLTKSFSVEIKGVLTKDGRFDAEKSKILKTSGDEDIVHVALTGIEAVGKSGFLQYLSSLDITEIILLVEQNRNTFAITVTSNMKSPELAKTVTSGMKSVLTISKLMKQREINGGERDPFKVQNEKDQLYLLENTKVSALINDFVLETTLDKTEIHNIAKRNLGINVVK